MTIEDVALRLSLGAVQMFLSGMSAWMWATADEYDSKGAHRPLMKRIFLAFAGLTFTTGLYLIVSTAAG